ncbi:MAG: DUF1552 domain-containing protein [Planctomycetota bacterium]
MKLYRSRREFLRDLGVGAAAAPFLVGLPSLGWAASAAGPRKRLVIVFSPNGVVPSTFWPEEEGEHFTLKESLAPLEPFKSRLLVLRGLSNRVRGDGDSHMRGIGCLLTGTELFPGNIQGGSHTPAGWAKGISIDQEIKNFLQADPNTRTRFGSLEFGVGVPDRADTWTRMVYAGPNKPIAPIDDPYQMLRKLYGRLQDREILGSVLDDVREDLGRVKSRLSAEDRRLLEEHEAFVREAERQLQEDASARALPPPPSLEPGVRDENDNLPKLSRMQIDLLVHSLSADFARVATLQYTNSVGQSRMRWIGVNEGHHDLSHKPDSDVESQAKLTKINRWFAEQVAHLVRRLSETPEPGGEGSLLDHTLVVWTNELGKGDTHTLDNIPFVLVGGGLGFRMGRSLKYSKVPHNRLLLALAHGFGHRIETFGLPALCEGGPLPNLA